MKKIITLLLVLSFVSIGSIAMASDGPSILNSIDQTMYQTLSDKQLSETIGESFIFVIILGDFEFKIFEETRIFTNQIGTLSYTIGAIYPWSFVFTPI